MQGSVSFLVDTDEAFEVAKLVRTKVFCEEQGFEDEFDKLDAVSRHLAMLIDGKPAGAARCYEQDGAMILGRICILPEYRGLELGSVLMHELETQFKFPRYRLHAQVDKAGFYRACGYEATDEEIDLDEGVPHQWMEKSLLV